LNLVTSDQALQEKTGAPRIGIALLAGYFVVYTGMLFAMHRVGEFEVSEPLLVLTILGVGFSSVAWLLTVGVDPLDYSILKPGKELSAIEIWLLPVILFSTWGLGLLRHYVPSDPENAIVILVAKLLVFVIFPAAIMWTQFGYSLRQLVPMSARTRHLLVLLGMSVLLLVFQAVLGRGLRDIANAHVPASTLWWGFPLTLLWLALEAGVVEEFFFRVLLQTRLSAVLKSELGGIVLASLIFGLAHAPGLYLRTRITQEGLPPHPSLLMAAGYSVVMVSVAGFFLGVLWARTHNFALVVLVHGFADLLPNLLPTLRSLHLLR
jgi:membrane protease YdiL (CAAX protease family)